MSLKSRLSSSSLEEKRQSSHISQSASTNCLVTWVTCYLGYVLPEVRRGYQLGVSGRGYVVAGCGQVGGASQAGGRWSEAGGQEGQDPGSSL